MGTMEKFRAYTRSWERPASQPEGGRFRQWSTDEPPPTHSIPPNVALKAAAELGHFDEYHLAVMDAYFYQNRNVTDAANLIDIATTVGIDGGEFERLLHDENLTRAVVADYNEAREQGVTGVPTVVLGEGFAIPGAQDLALYRRIIDKSLANAEENAE